MQRTPTSVAVVLALVSLLISAARGEVGGSPVPKPDADRGETVIRLSSGEWLRGRLEYLNYGRLYFDSRKLDRVDFDWDDVVFLESTESCELLFRNGRKLRGTAVVEREFVALTLPDGGQERLSRGDLLAIYPGEQGLRSARWFGKISGSVDLVEGNSDERSYDLRIDATRRAGSLEVIFDGRSSFSEADGAETRRR